LEIFHGHLVYFVVIWYISPRFGILYQEKSGNPAFEFKRCKKTYSLKIVLPPPFLNCSHFQQQQQHYSVASRVKAPPRGGLLQSSSSTYGSYSGSSGSSCFKLDICPDLLLAGLAAAFAAFFYLLHTAITMKGRKKRRSLSLHAAEVFRVKFLWDLVHHGTETNSHSL
jgi:hypothetical protein